jgi:hypothetical protein
VIVSIPVLFVPFEGPPASGASVLERKRKAVWAGAARNEFLAEVAQEVGRRPRKFLRRRGVSPEAVRWPDRLRQRVAILVEVPEHAERLERLLPAWEVQTAIPTDREPDDVEEDRDEPAPPGVIATLVYAALYGVRCDVLVRATAGTGRLEGDWVAGVGGRGTRPALMVDLLDASDERLRADAETRRLEYRQQGLRVLERAGEGRNT